MESNVFLFNETAIGCADACKNPACLVAKMGSIHWLFSSFYLLLLLTKLNVLEFTQCTTQLLTGQTWLSCSQLDISGARAAQNQSIFFENRKFLSCRSIDAILSIHLLTRNLFVARVLLILLHLRV